MDFGPRRLRQQEEEQSAGPYTDPELAFGNENAEKYKDITDRIPFVVSNIKTAFFGKYMG